MSDPTTPASEPNAPAPVDGASVPAKPVPQREIGGRTSGLEPTRYGDWEKDGRCIDF
ncbi:MAG: DUF1674 domain-containing protein [Rhodanobacteraceae bacterium]